jgi:4-amino-4-deoxy-L-arabinose transferase-like glycosyltransferase
LQIKIQDLKKFSAFIANFIDPVHLYNSNKNALLICLTFTVTFFVSGYFSLLGIDPYHQGIMLQGAMSLVDGRILFKDVAYHYGPLTAMIHYLFLKIGGIHLVSLQIGTALFYAMISVLLCIIWSRFMPRILVVVSYLCWLLLPPYFISELLPWSSVYSLFFLLLASYFLILFLEKTRNIFLFMSGVAVAFCFWCRLPVGCFLFVAVLSFLFFLGYLRKTKGVIKGILFYLIGNAIVSGGFCLWLIEQGSFKSWLQDIFNTQFQFVLYKGGYEDGNLSFFRNIYYSLFPNLSHFVRVFIHNAVWLLIPVFLLLIIFLVYYLLFKSRWKFRNRNYDIVYVIFSVFTISIALWTQYFSKLPYISDSLQNVFENDVWFILPLILLLLFFCIFFYLITNRRKRQNKDENSIYVLFSVVFVSMASWMQYYPVTSYMHAYWAASPFIGLLFYFLWQLWKSILHSQNFRKKVIGQVAFLIILICVTGMFSKQIQFRVGTADYRVKNYSQTVKSPSILYGMKATTDQTENLALISDVLIKYRNNNGDAEIIIASTTEDLYKYLYEYFLLYTYGFSKSNKLKDKKIILHSQNRIDNIHYNELLHVHFKIPLKYDQNDFYLYALDYKSPDSLDFERK